MTKGLGQNPTGRSYPLEPRGAQPTPFSPRIWLMTAVLCLAFAVMSLRTKYLAHLQPSPKHAKLDFLPEPGTPKKMLAKGLGQNPAGRSYPLGPRRIQPTPQPPSWICSTKQLFASASRSGSCVSTKRSSVASLELFKNETK